MLLVTGSKSHQATQRPDTLWNMVGETGRSKLQKDASTSWLDARVAFAHDSTVRPDESNLQVLVVFLSNQSADRSCQLSTPTSAHKNTPEQRFQATFDQSKNECVGGAPWNKTFCRTHHLCSEGAMHKPPKQAKPSLNWIYSSNTDKGV